MHQVAAGTFLNSYTCTLQMGGSAAAYAVVTLTSTALPLWHREPLASIVHKRTSLVLCLHALSPLSLYESLGQ